MKLRKYSITSIILLLTAFIVTNFSIKVNADTGPKPSVYIQFENMGDELCYGTLLSNYPVAGSSRVWDGDPEEAVHNGNENYKNTLLDHDTWKAFVEYEDPDGYYFVQVAWKVNETKEIDWTYNPPSSFKILLYYPETETFVSSGIYEPYAFDTYYTVDMDGDSIDSVSYNKKLSTNSRLTAYRTYNYIKEFLSLAARIVITIAIEMAVALLFGFRKKKQLLILALVNTITQVLLNVLLNVIAYRSGPPAFVMYYILFEIIVTVLEAILYCAILKKVSEPPKGNWYYILYALTANAVSFGAGLIVASILPGIF